MKNCVLSLMLLCGVLALWGAEPYNEPYRLQFHFSPPKNWTNDPNGLVFYQGEYHLFYQFNPFGNEWGHMSWGHAVSPDMLHWQHLPVALMEAGGVMIFSGSAVVDWHNSSALCGDSRARDKSCLVAIYTGHTRDKQTQNIACSRDRGRTWSKYEGNPVIDLGLRDFRDPKVFWHEPAKKWIMVAALPVERKVRFFASGDLKHWTALSDFGPAGATAGDWECPDLFPLPVDDDTRQILWVLSVNINPGALAGGSGNQYFIGRFDGNRFTSESPASQPLWADYGKDFYASTSFSDIPSTDGRRIWMGWFSNWQYAAKEPTSPWRGAQTVPRTLKLAKVHNSLRLVQEPVAELKALRGENIHVENAAMAAANQRLHGFRSDSFEILAEIDPASAEEVGFKLRTGASEETVAGYNVHSAEFFIDRTKSGVVDFSPDFPGRHAGPAGLREGHITLRIFVDRSSVELFGNGGGTVISDRVFPSPDSNRVEIYAQGDGARVVSLDIWKLNSVWRK